MTEQPLGDKIKQLDATRYRRPLYFEADDVKQKIQEAQSELKKELPNYETKIKGIHHLIDKVFKAKFGDDLLK